jgi:hypothetical protein
VVTRAKRAGLRCLVRDDSDPGSDAATRRRLGAAAGRLTPGGACVTPLALVAFRLPHAGPAPKLDEAGDSGYLWETTVKPDPAVLTRRKTIRQGPPCSRLPTPCAGGTDTAFFRHVGNAAGRTKLGLAEFRFGRRSSKPLESLRLTVRVR